MLVSVIVEEKNHSDRSRVLKHPLHRPKPMAEKGIVFTDCSLRLLDPLPFVGNSKSLSISNAQHVVV